MYILHLITPCSANDYNQRLVVNDYLIDGKTKGNAIKVQYNDITLIIPLANIAAIEEQ